MSNIERLPRDGNICLIDGDSLIYYEMDKPTLEEAIYGLDQRINHMLSECNTSNYVGFLTESNCYRYRVAPNYKGNRKGRPKPPIFYALREHIKQQWDFWAVKGLEADDLVSYYSYTDNRSTIICSPDKDVLYQCVGMHYNYQKAEFLHTSPDEALKFLWKQVLMGDSTDNIQGIPGVGAKTSENWLKDRTKDFEAFAMKKYVEKFGMVEGVMKFHETFRLVYLLKTEDDVRRETGITLLPLEVSTIKPEEDEPW
jgi:5'-3' exonuclease